MTDSTLIMFGAAVSFIAVAGAYVFIRERFTAEERPVPVQARRRRVARRGLRRAA